MESDSAEYEPEGYLLNTVSDSLSIETSSPTAYVTDMSTTQTPTIYSTSMFPTAFPTLSPSLYSTSLPTVSPTISPSVSSTNAPTTVSDAENDAYYYYGYDDEDDDQYEDDAADDDGYDDDGYNDDGINDDYQDDTGSAKSGDDDDVQLSVTSPTTIVSIVFGALVLILSVICAIRLFNSRRKQQPPTVAAQKGVVMMFGNSEDSKPKLSDRKNRRSLSPDKKKKKKTMNQDTNGVSTATDSSTYCADMSDTGYFGDSYNHTDTSSSSSSATIAAGKKTNKTKAGNQLTVDTGPSMLERGERRRGAKLDDNDDDDEKSPLIEKRVAKSVKFSSKIEIKSVSSEGSSGSSSFSSRGELIESFRNILVLGIEVLLHSSSVPGKSRRIRISLITSPGGTGTSYKGCMLFIQPTSRLVIRKLTKKDKIKLSDIVFVEKGKRTTVFQTCDSALDVADALCLSLVLSDDETIDLQTSNKMEREALFQGISMLVQEERIAL